MRDCHYGAFGHWQSYSAGIHAQLSVIEQPQLASGMGGRENAQPQLRLHAGGAVIPHPAKVAKGGEDAHFIGSDGLSMGGSARTHAHVQSALSQCMHCDMRAFVSAGTGTRASRR